MGFQPQERSCIPYGEEKQMQLKAVFSSILPISSGCISFCFFSLPPLSWMPIHIASWVEPSSPFRGRGVMEVGWGGVTHTWVCQRRGEEREGAMCVLRVIPLSPPPPFFVSCIRGRIRCVSYFFVLLLRFLTKEQKMDHDAGRTVVPLR